MLMNKQELKAGLANTPGYHYAKKLGSQLFVAGQVPNDASGNLVGEGDVTIQARQCLQNLTKVLDCYGFNQGDIRQLVVHVVGSSEQLSLAWSEVRRAFPEGVPPATLLGAFALGYQSQLVEIDATIIKEA